MCLRKIVLIFIAALSCLTESFAQKGSFFSKNSTAPSIAIDSLNELAFKAKNYNVSRAMNVLFVSKSLANRSGYRKGLAVAYLYEAFIFKQTGFDKRALSLFDSSLNISKSLKDTFTMARASEQIALYLKENGHLNKADSMLQEVMLYYKTLGKEEKFIDVNNDLCVISINQKKYFEASVYVNDALVKAKEIAYPEGEKNALYNLGLLNMALHINKQADSLFNIVLTTETVLNNKRGMAKMQLQFGKLELQKRNIRLAVSRSLTAYHLTDSVNDNELKELIVRTLISIYDSAKDKKNNINWQDTLLKLQQDKYLQTKDYAETFIDILHDEELKNLASEQKIHEDEEKSQMQTISLIVVALLLIVLSIVAVPIYRNYKRTKMFGEELAKKNIVIEKNASSLDQLNRAISKQNQKLEEENKMKDKLLSIISHDLRHPLVNTKSILDMINMKMITAAETEDLLSQLEGQYIKSLNLLDNLLFWIRSQMKGLKIERAKVNINLLLTGLMEEQRLPIQDKKIQINNLVNDDLELYAEKEMLRIIFRNLLINAIKFTPCEGSITFSTVVNEGFAYIMVKDTGVGMSSNVIQKVNVQQYFTSRGTSNEEGSGFGLILVRDLIAKHFGELLIESEPGKGSTFAVKLPLQAR